MRILDVCSGLGGASRAFREAGHEVVGIEVDEEIAEAAREQGTWEKVLVQDMRELSAEWLIERFGPFDFVWASPPCPTFSVMTISVYHSGDGHPDHPRTHEALALVHDVLALIWRLDPPAWIVENPMGMLRKYPFLQRYDRRTITQCRYGRPIRKPTDLWGGFPPTLELRGTCRPGDPCHSSSSRDSTNPKERPDRGEAVRAWSARETCEGAVGRPSSDGGAARSLIPEELSRELCEAMEAWDPDALEDSWRDHESGAGTEQVRLMDLA